MVGRASDILKLCCGQMSSEITGENYERAEKKTHDMHFTGPGLPTEADDGYCREEGKGADTIATKISKWGSLIQ